jgi:predicted DNA binding CopG/RHH family protein
MKKELPPAKLPLPRFGSDKEAGAFFDTQSIADVWDQLPATGHAKPSAALEESIRERHSRAKSPISIRLVPEQIAAAKKIAAAKSVGYQTQLRMWIAEGIEREARRRQPAAQTR